MMGIGEGQIEIEKLCSFEFLREEWQRRWERSGKNGGEGGGGGGREGDEFGGVWEIVAFWGLEER